MVDLLIADDHTIVRKGLLSMCNHTFKLYNVDEAEDLSTVMATLKRKQYTHLVIDMLFSDGSTMEILTNIRRLYPELNIMIFSMQSYRMYESALEKLGVTLWLSKEAKEEDTVKSMRAFLQNQKSIGPIAVVSNVPNDRFTPRETEIIPYLLDGVGLTEIGKKLNIDKRTCWTHKQNILHKTDTKNIKEFRDWYLVNKGNTSKPSPAKW